MNVRSLFLDFNSYFTSCEQHLQPRLRGHPVAVTPVVAPTGCCIAVSYEAKAHGVYTGVRVSDARHLCPRIRIIEARPDEYVRLHHRLVRLIDECSWVEQVYSVDEMHCPLTGQWQDPDLATALAYLIKARLREFSPALRCSIGLAPNSWLAKVATDLQKPDGLVLIRPDDLPDVLFPLELTDLPGINKRMLARLHYHGIFTVEELCRASRQRLRRVWGGIEGERFYFRLRGVQVPEPVTRKHVIGHSHVLPPALRTKEGARSTLFRLLHKASVRLRRERYYSRRLYARLDDYHGGGWEDSVSFHETQNGQELNHFLGHLLARQTCPTPHPSHAYVQLLDLVFWRNHTLPLFPKDEERGERLDSACDLCYTRYGRKGLYYGAEHLALVQKAAPVRIPFSRIPDPEYEF